MYVIITKSDSNYDFEYDNKTDSNGVFILTLDIKMTVV